MSSKPKHSFFRTVRFKLLLTYTLVSAVLASAGFAAAYFAIQSHLYREIDRGLEVRSRRMEARYALGEKDEQDEQILLPSQIPEVVLTAVKRRVPELTVLRAKTEREDDEIMYEVVGTVGDLTYEIEVDARGKIEEVERRVDDQLVLPSHLPAAVLEGLRRRVPGLSVVQATTRNRRNRRLYDIIAVTNDHSYEIIVDDQGTITELERRALHRNQEHLAAEFEAEAGTEGSGRVAHLLLSPAKKVLTSSDLQEWHGLAAHAEPGATQTISLPGRTDRIRLQCRRIFDGNLLCTAVTLAEPEALLRQCRLIFICTVAAMCLLGGLAGGLVARRAMTGVQRVTDAAAEIAAGNLNARVPVGSEGAEIEELADTFNDMQVRLHELVCELREISNNVAHDLRTPLTRIRAAAETTVTGSESVDSYRNMAGEVVEECDCLIEMINTMLEIAQAEAGSEELNFDTFDLNATVERAADLMQPVAEEKGIALSIQRNGAAEISGDRVRLQRVVANLLDNAIKYTDAGGHVKLSVSTQNGDVRLAIEDDGMGISPADMEHIFDRFYRGDSSRSLPGNGLGLSLVQAIVNAHEGDVQLESSPGKGTRVRVILPRNIAE